MHQTFYIDIDEEITLIIDRLRKSGADEAVIVVPKRALLIQSIVNLKLLKKEADNMRKKIVIVTQDKLGKLLVEKAGIAVENKLDDVAGDEMGESEKPEEIEKDWASGAEELQRKKEIQSRLDNIGSPDYAGGSDANSEGSDRENKIPESAGGTTPFKLREDADNGETLINKELVFDIGNEIKEKKIAVNAPLNLREGSGKPDLDMTRNLSVESKNFIPENVPGAGKKTTNENSGRGGFKNTSLNAAAYNFDDFEKTETEKLDKFEKFYKNDIKKEAVFNREKASVENHSLSRGIKKVFLAFGAVAFLAAAGVGAYLFVPKATVTIFAKEKIQKIDGEYKGDAGTSAIDLEKGVVPARVISINEELAKTFAATGSKNASNQKARGTITIYNEYSESTQPLVATTRFASEDGKIFRLVKGVVVSGTTKVGEETKPGAIEAEVVADEAGEDYNIEPGNFTIPGFKDSGEKYTKFYGKSSKAMIGGGNTSEKVKTVSAADVNAAKSKLNSELNQSVIKKIKEMAGEGEVVLDEAINLADSAYLLSSAEGAAAENFTMTVKTKASAIVFKEDDLKKLVEREITKNGASGINDLSKSISLEFGKADADFSKGLLMIRANAVGKIVPDMDLKAIKAGLLGKGENDLEAYLKAFPAIDRVEVNYWPTFAAGKIPSYEGRVEVVLDNN